MDKEVLIVEHDKNVIWIKNFLSSKNIKCQEISYLKGALKLVLEKPERWRAIVLDMKFPVELEGNAISGTGKIFLEKLKENKIEIPVLINSRQLFREEEFKDYPFVVKGQMVGHEFFDARRLREAFEGIKIEEQSSRED